MRGNYVQEYVFSIERKDECIEEVSEQPVTKITWCKCIEIMLEIKEERTDDIKDLNTLLIMVDLTVNFKLIQRIYLEVFKSSKNAR